MVIYVPRVFGGTLILTIGPVAAPASNANAFVRSGVAIAEVRSGIAAASVRSGIAVVKVRNP